METKADDLLSAAFVFQFIPYRSTSTYNKASLNSLLSNCLILVK